MKKAIYAVLAVFLIATMFTSCKKVWHCTCTFDNKVMYTEDLQLQVKGDAEKKCAEHDSTIVGQPWSCTIY